MSEVAFDTHAEIRKLEQSGIPLPQAEALLDMMSRAPASNQVAEGLDYLKQQVETNLATKDDLGALKVDLGALREHVDANMATKDDLAVLRMEVRADLYRALWMQGGILGGLILALAGVMVAFSAYMATIT